MNAVRPHMAARGRGRIVNFISLAAERGDAGLGDYAASKAGIAALTRSAAREWGRQGITVKKKSSALLGVIAVYAPKHTHDPLFLSNYVTINILDQIKSAPGVGDASLFGPQDYAMRAWVRSSSSI